MHGEKGKKLSGIVAAGTKDSPPIAFRRVFLQTEFLLSSSLSSGIVPALGIQPACNVRVRFGLTSRCALNKLAGEATWTALPSKMSKAPSDDFGTHTTISVVVFLVPPSTSQRLRQDRLHADAPSQS